jgi:hypothetical protein
VMAAEGPRHSHRRGVGGIVYARGAPGHTDCCGTHRSDSHTPEELERLESLRVGEFVHTRVYDVNLLKKGDMGVDLHTLFRAVAWSFVMRFLGSPLLVEGIRRIEHTMEG